MIHPYCEYVSKINDENDVDKKYHDLHYGIRIEDDNELFCRLVMEINQAGLSWHTILVKENNFRKAYHNFNINKVSSYDEKDFERLMKDAGVIRNRLKINAAIYNAIEIKKLQKEFGSFRKWLDVQSDVILAEARIQCSVINFELGSHPGTGSSIVVEDDTNTAEGSIQIKKAWVKLFKKHFKFVGGEIVGEFLMSISMLPGAHGSDCVAKKNI